LGAGAAVRRADVQALVNKLKLNLPQIKPTNPNNHTHAQRASVGIIQDDPAALAAPHRRAVAGAGAVTRPVNGSPVAKGVGNCLQQVGVPEPARHRHLPGLTVRIAGHQRGVADDLCFWCVFQAGGSSVDR